MLEPLVRPVGAVHCRVACARAFARALARALASASARSWARLLPRLFERCLGFFLCLGFGLGFFLPLPWAATFGQVLDRVPLPLGGFVAPPPAAGEPPSGFTEVPGGVEPLLGVWAGGVDGTTGTTGVVDTSPAVQWASMRSGSSALS